MNFRENEDAVSPVIGVILMVAITVILAAVIAAFVFGMTGDMPGATKNVIMTPKLVVGGGEEVEDGSADAIQLLIQGGSTADIKSLEKLKITVVKTDGTTSSVVSTTADHGGLDASTDDVFEISDPNKLGIGEKFTVKLNEASATGGPFEITVIGIFSDGSEQMLVKPTRL